MLDRTFGTGSGFCAGLYTEDGTVIPNELELFDNCFGGSFGKED